MLGSIVSRIMLSVRADCYADAGRRLADASTNDLDLVLLRRALLLRGLRVLVF